jgi:HlyD family secretion protein
MRSELMQRQLGSKLNLLQARDTRLDVEAGIARARGAQVAAGHDLEKARAERQTFLDDFSKSSLKALVDARADREAANDELKKAELRRSLVVLTAPADGVVLEIAQRSAGSVIRQAEPLFTLVPANVRLEAEVLVDPKDIGHVRRGQTARIKFDAFPFQEHGTATGTVRTISQDSFGPDRQAPADRPGTGLVYKVRLALDDTGLRGVPDGVRLIPGMSVQSEIVVGRRRVISYFLYPLIRGLDEGIREP